MYKNDMGGEAGYSRSSVVEIKNPLPFFDKQQDMLRLNREREGERTRGREGAAGDEDGYDPEPNFRLFLERERASERLQ